MKNIYLALTIIGTLVPNLFVIKETIASGNFMLYRYPTDTLNLMFANNVSSAFGSDLLIVVMVFFIWSFNQGFSRLKGKLYLIWVYTMLLGLAGGLPLYLYLTSKSKNIK